MTMPNPRYFIPAVILMTLLIASLAASLARGEEAWTDRQIVDAIWHTEGGQKAQYAYGIRSVQYRDIAEARKICHNTVRNNRRRYAQYGYKQYPDYLSFLASRYCPTTGKLSRAEKKLNGNWLRNVKYFLAKGEIKCK